MENEIKVNEFVRTKYGEIAKVIEYRDEFVLDKEIKFYGMYRDYICEDEIYFIVKHSPNLIDLIEVGDMVHTKGVLNEDWYWMFSEEMVKATKETIEKGIDLVEIVTKEMMESISYKVERKD